MYYTINKYIYINKPSLQTSNAAASILYQLSLNQEKQQILYEELSEVLPEKDSALNEQRLDQMVYLKACIKETLR